MSTSHNRGPPAAWQGPQYLHCKIRQQPIQQTASHTEILTPPAGVLHLDIKPGNILRQGHHYAVADWGIARISSKRAATRHPFSGGTIPYMAPERFTTEPTTIAADIYSIGMMTFELATGHLPFAAGSIENVINTIISHDYLSAMDGALSLMPTGWRKLIETYCHPDVPRRPQSYKAALQLLETVED